MGNFHRLLDTIFHQRVTFSIFFRLWLSFTLVVVLASVLTVYQLQKNIRPSAQRVVEDTLVDTSRLLAVLVAGQFGESIEQGTLDSQAVDETLSVAFFDDTTWLMPRWFHHKDRSQFRLYITDKYGKVLYDNRHEAVGKDYSRWNDVYLTLQGKYGARSTRSEPAKEETSVMYVASPIIKNGQRIGVVSVGKPVATLMPYINASRDDIAKTMLIIATLGILFSALMAWWLRHSIQAVNRYTQHLASDTPPHFYLGKELNELVSAIDEMKHTIENKAYVTDYVHTLTHELKSPLTAIRASGELLGEDLPQADREQFSQTILNQSDKLQQLIERMLVLAKLEQPNFKLTLQPASVLTIVESCLHEQQAWIQQKNLHVTVIGNDLPDCQIDRFWLTQAVQNVIDNALHFASHNVLIVLQADNHSLMVHVINDSPIMPDYVVAKAFERYFSYHGTPAKQPIRQKGTGLGLTLVKQVIDHHHGDVTFNQQRLSDWLATLQDSSLAEQLRQSFVPPAHSPAPSPLAENCIIVSLRLPYQNAP